MSTLTLLLSIIQPQERGKNEKGLQIGKTGEEEVKLSQSAGVVALLTRLQRLLRARDEFSKVADYKIITSRLWKRSRFIGTLKIV